MHSFLTEMNLCGPPHVLCCGPPHVLCYPFLQSFADLPFPWNVPASSLIPSSCSKCLVPVIHTPDTAQHSECLFDLFLQFINAVKGKALGFISLSIQSFAYITCMLREYLLNQWLGESDLLEVLGGKWGFQLHVKVCGGDVTESKRRRGLLGCWPETLRGTAGRR